jgi:mannose-6-phosphate isomerase-like protein (cupin superfamily)
VASATPIVVLPREGSALRTPSGAGVLVRVSSAATGGALTVFEASREGGDVRWPRTHRHTNMDETFFVVEGSFVFELDGRLRDAPAGTVVFLPRGIWHRFRSTGAAPGRVLCIAAPGGIDRFFEEAADPNLRLDETFRRHGFAFDET